VDEGQDYRSHERNNSEKQPIIAKAFERSPDKVSVVAFV
jgi:hypothetical protein